MEDRVLVYTCCDKKYAEFIPLFCAALLNTNRNLDIEIGTSLSQLSPTQTCAINRLQLLHPDASINIKFDFFKEKDGLADMNNNLLVEFNTVRFISNPTIRDKYTYISDIDIISLDRDFALAHIDDMTANDRIYSNIVRKGSKKLSGLHFCLTDSFYPIDVTEIDLTKNDEEVLYEIVRKKSKIDNNATFRPVHGIHMSLNRESVKGTTSIPGWFPNEWNYSRDHDNYKNKWFAFKKTQEYKCIEEAISESEILSRQISKLEKYYKEMPFVGVIIIAERFFSKSFQRTKSFLFKLVKK